MRRFLSIILVLQILLAHGAVTVPYVFADDDAPAAGGGAPAVGAAPAAGGGGGDAAPAEDRKLRIYLSVPIGTENVGYEKTTCTVKYKPDPTNRLGYRAGEINCRKEFAPDCAPSNPIQDCEKAHTPDPSFVGPPTNALAECVAGATDGAGEDQNIVYCRPAQVITAGSGSGLIKAYTALIYKWAAGTVGIVAVLVIVVSGIQIITSDVSGDVDSAKNRIGQSLIGLAILFLSAVILYTINPNFFN